MSPKASDVTLPAEHYTMLLDLAVAQLGTTAAASWASGFSHLGDALGTVLCESQRLGDGKMSLAMTAYMVAFRKEFERLGVTPPTLAEVLKALPLSINETRYPEADLEKMQRVLARNVPAMYGESV